MRSPTPAEMAILHALWRHGPSTVRAVHTALADRGVGYTTVLKTLQIMLGKALVTRDASARSHVYAAAVERDAVQSGLVRQLAHRAFAGSTAALVMHALRDEAPSTAELDQIRALLAELDEAP